MDNILLKKFDNYATVTINRPDKLNALNQDTVNELFHIMQGLHDDSNIRSIIITGAGPKAFVAGADISEIVRLDAESAQKYAENGQAVFRFIEKMPKPVIAAVNGFALGGGCELAMACHIRYAAANARFGLPEVNLGVLPGYGGTQRFPRLVGLSNALPLILTGDMFDAQKALQIGLVSAVFEAEQLLPEATNLAERLAGQAPIAVKLILQSVFNGIDQDIDSAFQLESANFGRACATEDMREGTRAFLEKRKANFTGK